MTTTKESIEKGLISPELETVEAAKTILEVEKVQFVLCAFTESER